MHKIQLTRGKVAIIDSDDLERVSLHKWHTHRGTAGYFYACTFTATTNGTRQRILLHRYINATPDQYETDHINGDTLDNRKSNLRTATRSQNQHNSKLRKDNKSGYKGVGWHKATMKWRVRINKDGENVFTAYFDDIKDAARAYNTEAFALFGEFAKLNKIKETI